MFKRYTLLFLGLAFFVQASPRDHSKRGADISDFITSISETTQSELDKLLSFHLPKLSYTGLATIAGTAGIIAAVKGMDRVATGVETDNRTTTNAGAVEFAAGVSITAVSVIIINYLWKHK